MQKLLGAMFAFLLVIGMAVGGLAAAAYPAIGMPARVVAFMMGLGGVGTLAALPFAVYQGRNKDGTSVGIAHPRADETWFKDERGVRGPYPRRSGR